MFLKPFFHIWDLSCILASFFIALSFRFQIYNFNSELISKAYSYKSILIFSLITWFIIASILNMQHVPHRKNNEQIWKYFYYPQAYFCLLVSLFIIILNFDLVSRLFLIYFLFIQFGLLLLARIIRIGFVRRLRATGYNSIKLFCILPDHSTSEKLSLWSNKNPWYGINVINKDHLNSEGLMDYYKITVKTLKVGDYLIVDFNHIDNKNLQEVLIMAENRGVQIFQTIDNKLNFSVNMKNNITKMGPIYLIKHRKQPLKQPVNQINKRMFDFIFSLLFLITIYSWLSIIIGIIIKFTSKGPIFFKQERVGKDGRKFNCLKFRTMHDSLSKGRGNVTSIDDNRIYSFGKFLRKSNLDEIPQFFNVLWGDMSIVGPRPHMTSEDNILAQKIREYRIRHWVRPGITGLAATKGFRGGTEDMDLMQQRINYDIVYVESWTLRKDVKICFETFRMMLVGSNKGH